MKIMGILNLTPDSFYDGGRFYIGDDIDVDRVLRYVDGMIADGADIIDIGAQSTRPGYIEVSKDEELRRLSSVVDRIINNFDIPISIDTYMPDVAKECIDMGVDIVNDISFLSDDMLDVIASSDVRYVLTHNRDIDIASRFDNTITMDELISELRSAVTKLQKRGISSDSIIIDPGIGFGKSNFDDIMILGNMQSLKSLGLPILIGASNKSCIGYVTGADKDNRLDGTLAITARAYESGIDYIRVHDVGSNARMISMINAMRLQETE